MDDRGGSGGGLTRPAAGGGGPALAAPSTTPASELTPEEAAKHVTIWNRLERRKIAGNAAPLRRNVGRYLAKHPECEVFNGQDKRMEGLLAFDPVTGLPVVAQNEHVPIWHLREKRKVTGNAAPLRKNVHTYLAKHPDCEIYNGQDKELEGGGDAERVVNANPGAGFAASGQQFVGARNPSMFTALPQQPQQPQQPGTGGAPGFQNLVGSDVSIAVGGERGGGVAGVGFALPGAAQPTGMSAVGQHGVGGYRIQAANASRPQDIHGGLHRAVGAHGHNLGESMPYDEMASSWSNMPSWQGVQGQVRGDGGVGNGVDLNATPTIPIPVQARTTGLPGRGILGVGSVERTDALMGGMSLGKSLGGGEHMMGGATPGSLGGFLFGRGDGFLAASPTAMDFSPSNFLTHSSSPGRGR